MGGGLSPPIRGAVSITVLPNRGYGGTFRVVRYDGKGLKFAEVTTIRQVRKEVVTQAIGMSVRQKRYGQSFPRRNKPLREGTTEAVFGGRKGC